MKLMAYKPNLNLVPFLLPLLLSPLLIEWFIKINATDFFTDNHELFLIINIFFIVVVRLIILDSMLFLFTRSTHALHITLIRIVGLYLEITLITILFFAFMFYILSVFHLFQYNGSISPEALMNIKQHDFLSALYISTVSFTTLGLGDWVPQSINAMMSVSVEVILGVVQAGVFMAIIIYAHQNKEILSPKETK